MKIKKIKQELELIVKNLKRTITSREIPLNILNYNNEDTWNRAMNFSINEINYLRNSL